MIIVCLCIAAAAIAGGQALRIYIEKTKEEFDARKAFEKTDEGKRVIEAADGGTQSSGEDRERTRRVIERRYSRNSGAIMNVAEKRGRLVTGIAVIIFVAVLVWFVLTAPKKGFRLFKSGFALMLGGAAGNIYERITKGYVTDYFSFCFLKKAIFNINDMFIITGSLLAMAGYVLSE